MAKAFIVAGAAVSFATMLMLRQRPSDVPLTASATSEGAGDNTSHTVTVAAGPGFRSPPPHRKSAGTPVKPYRPSSNTPHQGEREKARRLRQALKRRARELR